MVRPGPPGPPGPPSWSAPPPGRATQQPGLFNTPPQSGLFSTPPPSHEPEPEPGRYRKVLGAAGIVLLLALTIAGFVNLHNKSQQEQAAAAATTAPTDGIVPGAGPGGILPATESPSVSISAPPSLSIADTASASPAGKPPTKKPTTKPTPNSTLSAPPQPALVGRLISDLGHCLDMYLGTAIEGSGVQVNTCSGQASQRWTMTTTGTLRNGKFCAQIYINTAVLMAPCSSTGIQQWRRGPNRTLVNPPTGRCLTDPGPKPGDPANMTGDICTGAAGQRWNLP